MNDDDNAFPIPGWKDNPEFNGLTKRELFAAMAMQGMAASEAPEYGYSDDNALAKRCVRRADALLAALRSTDESEAP